MLKDDGESVLTDECGHERAGAPEGGLQAQTASLLSAPPTCVRLRLQAEDGSLTQAAG